MSIEITLGIVLPVIVVMLKFIPGLLHRCYLRCGRQEDTDTEAQIDLEVGSGVLLSPEPYHMTWSTPEAQALSPFDTPTTATPELRVIERPPRSPKVMTSLVSPIKTGCSPPKRTLRGEEQLPHSPVIPNTLSAATNPFRA
ncbi:hypothetical protein PPTG_07251 [Phytophthora nicotianae INRA-310]|uniref:Uncharacterized protein n=1 Tax=Phytophthora nicotianae (strain INRA-310) TaxID=761204 RepID=W2QRZ6_PHYN3|nr:hypothetical protein PPTG_07251 [Phytophthora nicotianae INRA-310]ETN15035.1 hypothetical protein PPTG_07251 [Phytophthora nicotianae INRA-310]